MGMTSRTSIDDYANSMFRFDVLNPRWIECCTAYLRETFGARLQDAVAMDYAFGRGNWAVALRRAGAKRVIAVDASATNCHRLRAWLNEHGPDGVEVVHANVLEAPIDARVDVLWAHGILPVVEHPMALMRALGGMLSGPNALMHAYAYDRDSMRQWLVDTARRFTCYASEAEFRVDAPLFTSAARLRGRDDLTTPWIHWMSAQELGQIGRSAGLTPLRRHADFSEWQRGERDEEFQPHNLMFGMTSGDAEPSCQDEPIRPLSGDLRLLAALAEPLFELPALSREAGRRHGMGLCNTHFTALAQGGMQVAMREDLLFVLYVLLAEGLESNITDPWARQTVRLAEAALRDTPRADWPEGDSVLLVPYLKHNTIRL